MAGKIVAKPASKVGASDERVFTEKEDQVLVDIGQAMVGYLEKGQVHPSEHFCREALPLVQEFMEVMGYDVINRDLEDFQNGTVARLLLADDFDVFTDDVVAEDLREVLGRIILRFNRETEGDSFSDVFCPHSWKPATTQAFEDRLMKLLNHKVYLGEFSVSAYEDRITLLPDESSNPFDFEVTIKTSTGRDITSQFTDKPLIEFFQSDDDGDQW